MHEANIGKLVNMVRSKLLDFQINSISGIDLLAILLILLDCAQLFSGSRAILALVAFEDLLDL